MILNRLGTGVISFGLFSSVWPSVNLTLASGICLVDHGVAVILLSFSASHLLSGGFLFRDRTCLISPPAEITYVLDVRL